MRTVLFAHAAPLTEGIPDLLVVVIFASGALAALSLALALVTVGSHLWSRYQDRIWERRKQEWKNQLLKIVAGECSPRSLTDQVQRDQYDAFLEFLLSYAVTIRGAAAERIQALVRPFLPRLRQQLASRWPLVRAQAAQRIGLLGGPQQAEVLWNVLDDPSDRVVEIAFRRLARLGRPDDTERLLECLDRLTHVDRRQISSALVELGEDATPALRSAMADDVRSPFGRVCCAEALRWLGDSAAAPVAARLLRETDVQHKEDSPEVTASLLRLLRALGQESHRPIVRRFCRSPVPFVRIHAARALGQLGTAEDEALLGALVRGDDSRWVALSAAQSLLELGRTTPLRKLQNEDHRRAELASNFLSVSLS